MEQKRRYDHSQLCEYCQEHGNSAPHKDGGCRHYRGGKTARKRGK